MEDGVAADGTEALAITGGGDTDGEIEKLEGDTDNFEPDTENVNPDTENLELDTENVEADVERNEFDPENGEGDLEKIEGDVIPVDHLEISGEGEEIIHGEHLEGEQIESEYGEGELIDGERAEVEQIEGEHVEDEHADKVLVEGVEIIEEHVKEEQTEIEKQEEPPAEEEKVEEEEKYVEEPPPDPAAPYNFSESTEALREPFELRPDQLMEVELLWAEFQNYTPAYTDLDNFITEKELVYMLKSLLLMTYTPEQLVELIDYCVRPPHPEGHITYEQFLQMVIMRQRDFPIEEELRSALQVYDPDKTGLVDREYLKEMLSKQGHKMSQRQLDNLIKEVDLSNDGTIGIEDVVGTMCIDLNTEDIQMLKDALNPNAASSEPDEYM